MMEYTRLRPFRRRLLLQLLFMALIAMLLVSFIQVLLINRDANQQQENVLNNLVATQIPLLQQALWNTEIATLEMQLRRILEFSEISSLRLQSETGLDISLGTQAVSDRADAHLNIYSPADDNRRLGGLEVDFNKQWVAARMRESVVQSVFGLSLYTLMLFAVLFRVLHRDIGQPLRLIADYVAQLKPQKNAPSLNLKRKPRRWHDEVDLISWGLDTLHESMRDYAEQHESAIEQLAQERDSMDQRAAERTSELAYLNGYLQLISGTSLKLMHLRKSQYPQAMAQTLQLLGQYLHLDACALFDNQQLRVHWMNEEDPGWLTQLGLQRMPDCAPGWSVVRLDERTLMVSFASAQRHFTYAARGAAAHNVGPEREGLLQGVGQWLFSLLQHWDHVIGLEQAQLELLEMSRTDPLTRLANRRHFEQHQIDELHRAQRLGYPVSMLMLDVDYFKAFNDHYGHAEGDACLVALAALLKGRFKRAGEMVARVGGEEFAVLLPGMDLQAAQETAEQLRLAIADLHIPHAGSERERVTVSIGVAQWSVEQGGDTEQIIDSLMRTADAGLYQAKRTGRNQVVAKWQQ